jgi:hypothetical protein
MSKLVEIERHVYGGGDGKAINRHSERVYRMSDGRIVKLSRNLSFVKPEFEIIGPIQQDYVGVCPNTEVDGSRHFGKNWPWSKAVDKMCEVLGVEIDES